MKADLCDPSLGDPDAYLNIWANDETSHNIGGHWGTTRKDNTDHPVWNERHCWDGKVDHFRFELFVKIACCLKFGEILQTPHK